MTRSLPLHLLAPTPGKRRLWLIWFILLNQDTETISLASQWIILPWYTYDKNGNLIDRTKITKKTVGGSWGLIGGALETTTERSTMHTGPLTNPIRTSTKVKTKFGGLAFDREVVGNPLQ